MYNARELVLSDGLSRMTPSDILDNLHQAKLNFYQAMRSFRLGGGEVRTGADFITSSNMMDYQAGMYGSGCPWRSNASDCSLPDGSQVDLLDCTAEIVLRVGSIEFLSPSRNPSTHKYAFARKVRECARALSHTYTPFQSNHPLPEKTPYHRSRRRTA
mmetsp:Transcript_60920/g.163114  ORF Transcript_60920/g.163114 Transcript_60920/m.163114 type:complete len:158 (+) Transcript_60920:5331-5804(+)